MGDAWPTTVELDIAPGLRPSGRPALLFTGALIAAAVLYQGYNLLIAFDPDDTNHLETPLALAVARQVADGPGTLYGPFSGSDPLVLIHAPLYYRLAGWLARPPIRSGVEPTLAALAAGRSLSFLGLLVLIAGAGWIARQDGAPPLAGLWAALLVASSPVFGTFGQTVRPDTLGLAFQTWGFGLALKALRDGSSARTRDLIASGLLFGLAAGVKQNLIVTAAVAALLLAIAAVRGRLPRAATTLGLATGLLTSAAYYGWEEFLTGGMMSRSVFVLPSRLRRTAEATFSPFGHVAKVFATAGRLAVGSLALAVALPHTAFRGKPPGRLDAFVGLAFLGELAAMVPLCMGSEGAWVNYAMPAVVWGSVLLGRAAGRTLRGDASGLPWRSGLLVLAGLVILAANVRLVAISARARAEDRRSIGELLADPAVAATPRDGRYFVGLPQANRLYGRVSLAHDEWLYGSYERMGMAEPRSGWLARGLTDGRFEGTRVPDPVTMVIVPADDPTRSGHVFGLDVTLPQLGYRLGPHYGRYWVWRRTVDPS